MTTDETDQAALPVVITKSHERLYWLALGGALLLALIALAGGLWAVLDGDDKTEAPDWVLTIVAVAFGFISGVFTPSPAEPRA